MNALHRARFTAILLLAVVALSVFVFGREDQRQPDDGDASTNPLNLRKLTLNVDADDPSPSIPDPQDSVPIDWQRHQPQTTYSTPIPNAPRAPLPPPPQWAPTTPASATNRPLTTAPRQELPPPPTTQPTAKPKPRPLRYHRIVDGETLQEIAARYLGSPDRYLEIYAANRAVIPHPDVLPLHAKIVIPEAKPSEQESQPARINWPTPRSAPVRRQNPSGLLLPE